MALNGRLEDMNLLEILQIVAFSKKTGTLAVEGPMGGGAVLFREGLVLCAIATTTANVLRPLADQSLDISRQELMAEQIKVSLQELVGMREGRFEFRLSKGTPTHLNGMDVSNFLVNEGVDPQELMLGLARQLDEARRDGSDLLESPERRAAPPALAPAVEEPPPSLPAEVTVVLVDDETQVLETVRKELSKDECTLETAQGPVEALTIIDRLEAEGRSFIVVTDFAMLSSSGDNFEGGFEIVQRLREMHGTRPVILMAESLSQEDRARAKELGIRKVAFKPALAKLDAEEYTVDLRAFAGVIRRELARLADKGANALETVPELNHDVMFDFLKTMTEQLVNPANGIARMILRVAAKYCERALLYLVKGPRARGLAGVRLGRSMKQVVEEARSVSFDLQEVQPFAEVVYSKSAVRPRYDIETLPDGVEPGKAQEGLLLPILHNGEVLAILACDNPNSGKPLGKLSGLELFLTQAAMAMENASLHRKLSSFEDRFTLEDQGPLTQELTRIIRSSN